MDFSQADSLIELALEESRRLLDRFTRVRKRPSRSLRRYEPPFIHEQVRTQAGSGIVAWREARLRIAGFDPQAAARLACEEAIDLHALLDLIDRGCPPPLAARILAPLDDQRAAW